MSELLVVRDLVTRFDTPEGVVHAVNGVSFTLAEGESLALVGESGCGKSVTVASIMRLIPNPPGWVERGEALFHGRNLLQISAREMRRIQGREISMIFQDPMTSLNPVLSIGRQLTEALTLHLGLSRPAANETAVEMLTLVGIPDAGARLANYPRQFSGGQRQRIMIAMALARNPALLIADEPTTALDVTMQAQILNLVKKIKEKFGTAVIWITHDLGVVAGLVDKVAVMYAGYLVEAAPVRSLYEQTSHPYTLGLLQSLPRFPDGQRQRLIPIDGAPPDLLAEPDHCPFAPRCRFAVADCWQKNPPLLPVGPHHTAACWRWEEVRFAQ